MASSLQRIRNDAARFFLLIPKSGKRSQTFKVTSLAYSQCKKHLRNSLFVLRLAQLYCIITCHWHAEEKVIAFPQHYPAHTQCLFSIDLHTVTQWLSFLLLSLCICTCLVYAIDFLSVCSCKKCSNVYTRQGKGTYKPNWLLFQLFFLSTMVVYSAFGSYIFSIHLLLCFSVSLTDNLFTSIITLPHVLCFLIT